MTIREPTTTELRIKTRVENHRRALIAELKDLAAAAFQEAKLIEEGFGPKDLWAAPLRQVQKLSSSIDALGDFMPDGQDF